MSLFCCTSLLLNLSLFKPLFFSQSITVLHFLFLSILKSLLFFLFTSFSPFLFFYVFLTKHIFLSLFISFWLYLSSVADHSQALSNLLIWFMSISAAAAKILNSIIANSFLLQHEGKKRLVWPNLRASNLQLPRLFMLVQDKCAPQDIWKHILQFSLALLNCHYDYNGDFARKKIPCHHFR